MDPMERLHIRSSEFESSMKRGLSELREDEEFFDVTLACGSKQVKAHKVILSACSPFFRSLIRSIPHQHPFIYLRGVQFRHLESLLCFMYNGEVSVTYKDLTGLMAVAKELQVIGLIKSVAKPQGKDNTTGVDSTSKQTELNLEGVPGPSAIDEENRKDVTIKKELEDLLSDNEMEDDTMDNEFECSVGTHMLDPPDNEYSGFDDTVPDHIAQGSSGISINDIEASPIDFNEEVHLIKSTRGRDILVDSKKHTYYMNRENKSKALSYWTCTKVKCMARVHTISVFGQVTILKRVNTHSHRPSKKELLKQTIIQSLMSEALSRPDVPCKELVTEALSKLDSEDIACLPTFQCLQRNVRRWRKAKYNVGEEILP